jgi:O-Antigen ligase
MYMDFHLGGLTFNVTSLLTLLVVGAGVATWKYPFRITLVDVCLMLYLFGAFYSDENHGALKPGIYAFIFCFSKSVLPYLVGRLLIEQSRMRTQFASTLVLCLALIGAVSLLEFVKEYNFFQRIVEHLTHFSPGWIRQTRWGFGRIAGPYGHAIIAGMIFSAAVMLQLWLVKTKKWENSSILRRFGVRKMPRYISWAVWGGLYMTQSRGPWMGFAFGLIAASIGFAKDRRRAAKIAISVLLVTLAVTWVYLDKYTDTSVKAVDQDQQNAEYRRNLITVYQPLIEQGGLWGWGTPVFYSHGLPTWIPGHDSIDNEYIRIGMAQGYLGLGSFTLMMLLSIVSLARLCYSLNGRDDRLFAYCMLGIVLGMTFTLTTVYLGDPMMQIVFLFLGWSQSIIPTRTQEQIEAPAAAQLFEFERVFV